MNSTSESPVAGLHIFQPVDGFRYGSEAFWLVGFALEGGRPTTVLDLGTGSGIIASLFAAQGTDSTGIDVRSEWAPFWDQTLHASSIRGRLRLLEKGVNEYQAKPVDLVVSNPPFFAAQKGPSSPNPWKRAARTEGEAGLSDFISAAAKLAHPTRGRICFVLPLERADEANKLAQSCGLNLARHAQVGRKRVLLEWKRSLGPVEITTVHDHGDEVDVWYRLACEPKLS